MDRDEKIKLQALLAQLQDTHRTLADRQAGVCVLHLDAAVGALEGHLRRDGRAPGEQLQRELAALGS